MSCVYDLILLENCRRHVPVAYFAGWYELVKLPDTNCTVTAFAACPTIATQSTVCIQTINSLCFYWVSGLRIHRTTSLIDLLSVGYIVCMRAEELHDIAALERKFL